MDYKAIIAAFYELFRMFLDLIGYGEKADEIEGEIKDIIGE